MAKKEAPTQAIDEKHLREEAELLAAIRDRRIERQNRTEGKNQAASNDFPETTGEYSISLTFYHRRGTTTARLSEGQDLTVGRTAPANIIIEDESLSRSHARFSIADGSIRLEDLGSTNGTWLNLSEIDSASLQVDDEITLGAVLVVLQEGDETHAPESHDAFRTALEEELIRSRFFNRMVSILAFRCNDADEGQDEAHISRWSEVIRRHLRPIDRLAMYSHCEVEVLLPEAAGDDALATAEKILTNCNVPLRCGVASFPHAATSADGLLEAVHRATRDALPGDPVSMAPPASTRVISTNAQAGTGPLFDSAAMREIYATIDRLATATIPVLIQGETGVGKEVVAHSIHDRGPRKDEAMVSVNCGAIPSQLLESSLFGNEKGAFTGADTARKGVFEEANGGTVFLDEIGELPATAQAALLRTLESKQVVRVGAALPIDVDIRILAATNRDLDAMCASGEFRQDLLYRLNAMTLTIPPLRSRVEDIDGLALRFLALAAEANGRNIDTIEPDALAHLRAYNWPGNVRELKNTIERAVVVAESDAITVHDLTDRIRSSPTAPPNPTTKRASAIAVAPAMATEESLPPLDESLPPLSGDDDYKSLVRQYEAHIIRRALHECDGKQTAAAAQLGMPLRTLVHKIKQLGLKKDYTNSD